MANMVSLIHTIKSDFARKSGHYFLVDTFFERYVKTALQLGTLAVVVYRFGAWAEHIRFSPARWVCLALYHLFNLLSEVLTGIHINRKVPIGDGFIIHNFSCIRINAETIGDNFTVNQGVTVDDDWRRSGRPTLGSNVFLGSGSKVLGNITIGDNVVVAANALVIDSIPDNCTVVGVPARIISRDASSNYLQLKK
jgi:serine O-acetyltransferase